MSKLTALALSIAVLGGLWTFLALGPLGGMVLVWAGFIAWACYFHTGGDNAALQKTIAGMIYGGVIAGVALALVVANPAGLPDVAECASLCGRYRVSLGDCCEFAIAIGCACECVWLCCGGWLCAKH